MTVKILPILALLLFVSQAVFSQGDVKTARAQLKQSFEGKTVRLKVDMPADQLGIDLFPDNSVVEDLNTTLSRTRKFGVSLRTDARPVITKVTIVKNRIIFQLDGGGYVAPRRPVKPPPTPKSPYEKWLEVKVKTDKGYWDELIAERHKREALDKINYQKYQNDLEKWKKLEKVAPQVRLKKGSRFNLIFTKTKASSLIPEDLIKLLAAYVDFTPIK